MLQRLRSVQIRPGREQLSGQVEVEETYIGGEEAGLAGGRAKGKKALVAVAVEVKSPKGFGRCRMRIIPDGSATTLHAFIIDNVAPGSTVITDGWSGYRGIEKAGYTHDRRSQRAAKALGEDIESCCLACTASRPWPNGGCCPPIRAPWRSSTWLATMDEFCFRFNRRRSSSRGLPFLRVLQLAVGHDPVRYRQLIASPKPKKIRPAPPGSRGNPTSLDRPRATRPWRYTA